MVLVIVERAGIDNLVRERQIIRSTREEHDEDVKDFNLYFSQAS